MVMTNKEVPLQKKSKVIGTYGTAISSGIFDEEYLSELKGTKAADVFDKMRTQDGQIKMVLNAVLNPLRSANWEVHPYSDDPQDIMMAEFVEFILFRDMIRPFSVFLNEALTFTVFGHSVFEIVHKNVANNPKFGDYTGIQAMAWRSQKTIKEWHVDEKTGALNFIRQESTGDLQKQVDIPAEFLIIFTMDLEGADYEATRKSLLRPCYGSWYLKQYYKKLEAIGNEKHAVGTPIGTIPAGKEETDDAEEFSQVVEKYSTNEMQSIIVPEGYKLEIIQGNFDSTKLRMSINGENEEIAHAFMANFLMLGQSGSGGSYSLGADLSDFFSKSIGYIAKIIEDTINTRLIPHLIDRNFEEQENYPYLQASGIEDVGEEYSRTIKNLIESGAITSDSRLEDHVRKLYHLPMKIEEEPAGPEQPAPTAETEPQPTPEPEPTTTVTPKPEPEDSDGRQTEEFQDVQLADKPKTPRSLIIVSGDHLSEVFTIYMDMMRNKLIADIINRYKILPEGSKAKATKNVKVGFKNKYKKELKKVLTNLVTITRDMTKKEMKDQGFEFQDEAKIYPALEAEVTREQWLEIPKEVRDYILMTMETIVEAQATDIEKSAVLSFGQSMTSTKDPDLITSDMLRATNKKIQQAQLNGSSTSGSTVNTTRLEMFLEPETRDQIESWTFTNPDPKSEICRALTGTTFAVSDTASLRYRPPLHHQCKSLLKANYKGNPRNPKINPGGLVPLVGPDELKSITYFTDKEQRINLSFMIPDQQKIQCLIFDRLLYSRDDAVMWATEYGFTYTEVEETDQYWILRQKQAGLFESGSFKNIPICQGIQAVEGVLITTPGFQPRIEEKPSSVIEETSLLSDKKFQQPTTVQSLILSKEVFTLESAKKWILDHDFSLTKIDETETSYRFRQKDPSAFKDGSFRTITITKGVKAVIGKLKEQD